MERLAAGCRRVMARVCYFFDLRACFIMPCNNHSDTRSNDRTPSLAFELIIDTGYLPGDDPGFLGAKNPMLPTAMNSNFITVFGRQECSIASGVT